MAKMIFVNLPVADVEKSVDFLRSHRLHKGRALQPAWHSRSDGVV